MTMLPEPFDAVASDLLRRVESDPEAAAALLLHAAKYLREQRSMPPVLADYLAGAFECAAQKPKEFRAKQLTDELNLSARNRRKSGIDWLDAYEACIANEGLSVNAISDILAKNFDVSRATARLRVIEALEVIQSGKLRLD